MDNSHFSGQDPSSNDSSISVGEENALSFIEMAALDLQAAWHRFVSQENNANSKAAGKSSAKGGPGEYDELRTRLSDFKPDMTKIFQELDSPNGVLRKSGYDKKAFNVVQDSMLIAEFHKYSIPSAALSAFDRQEKEIMMMIADSSPELKKAFFSERDSLNKLKMEEDELSSSMAERTLKNAALNQEYFRVFAELILKYNKESLRCSDLSIQLDLKDKFPKLSREQLEIKAAQCDEIAQSSEVLKQIEAYLSKRLNGRIGHESMRQAPEAVKKAAKKKYGRLAKDCKAVWKLVHEDRLLNNRNYKLLSPEDKQFLSDLSCILPRGTTEDLGSPKMFHRFDFHSVEGLKAVLNRVRVILNNAGIDCRYDMLISGNNLEEKLDFLRIEIRRLNKSNKSMKAQSEAQLEVMINLDKALRNPDEIKAKLENDAMAYKQAADLFETQLEERFRPNIS